MTITPRTLVLLLLLVSTLLSGCNMPGLSAVPIAQASLPSETPGLLLVQAPGNATPTPTPFQPIPPTPVYVPTNFPTPTPPPTATPQPTPEPQRQAGRINPGQGLITYLLLGSDQREGEAGFRTDSIILVVLDTDDGTVSMTSFPRDLYINIPGWGMDRINTAWAHGGGFKSLAATMEYNFGVRPDHYVMINFHSFTQIIDSLGGIEVNVKAPFTDKRQGYGRYTVDPGVVPMDGKLALWYVRARKSSNDFSRTRRQQEIILAVAHKLIGVDGIRRAPELYALYRKSVSTNLGLEEILPLLPLAAEIAADESRIHHYFIGPGQVYDWITPGGGMVLLPNQEGIMAVMRKALKGH